MLLIPRLPCPTFEGVPSLGTTPYLAEIVTSYKADWMHIGTFPGPPSPAQMGPMERPFHLTRKAISLVRVLHTLTGEA